MKRILSRFNPRAKDSGQRSPRDHHIDKPADGSVSKQDKEPKPVDGPKLVEESVKDLVEELVEESAAGSVNKPSDEPVNGSVSNPFTLEVTVIPVSENNVTPTSAISKGLIRLSRAMKTMNRIPTVKNMPGETCVMVSFIINALHIMATVPDKDRPKCIYTYHVFATRTSIATFFNLMGIIVAHLPKSGLGDSSAWGILKDTFSAYLYFGIAVLSTPIPRSAHIAAAIGVELENASSYTSTLSPEETLCIAEKIMERTSPARQTDIRPLVSIFTSDQLAGLVRRMAYYIDPHEPDQVAKRMVHSLFDLDIDVAPQFCPCKENSRMFPICLCRAEPYSQFKYDRVCSRKLLPVI